MKIPVLTFILFLSAVQVTAVAYEREGREDQADMRDYRGEDDAYDDRPWRETLRNCREMKKAGKLSRSMKEECKAARELKKASKQ